MAKDTKNIGKTAKKTIRKNTLIKKSNSIMKKILIITERRAADFSRFKPIIKLIQKDKKLDYQLIVTGIHLVKKYGYTINEINKEKFKIFFKI